jgi:hypothetical protein
VALLLVVSGCSDHSGYSDAAIRDTKKRGNKIIKALQEFKRENNEYPSELSDLKPDYIKTIKQPKVGEAWKYNRLVSGDYDLIFPEETRGKPHWWYNSSSRKWQYDSGQF